MSQTRNTVRKPGLSIFIGDGWERLDLDVIPVPIAPAIAVEVLSPSEHVVDLNRKVLDYLGAGSKEVWLLDHANGELQVRTKAGIRLVQGGLLRPGEARRIKQSMVAAARAVPGRRAAG